MRLCLATVLALGLAEPAAAQNLLPDPAFKNGVGAWSPSAISGNYTMTFAPGVSVRPGSGSALLSLDAPSGGTYSVCVAVTGGRTYEWGYWIYFPDSNRTTGLAERLDGYSGPACTGSFVGGYVLSIVPGSTGSWHGGRSLIFPAPADCRSILVGFSAVAPVGVRATAYVDDVFLAPAGTVPPIEPAPAADVPALSPAVLCALAGALLLAGTRALRS
jgi:hypothetical protein